MRCNEWSQRIPHSKVVNATYWIFHDWKFKIYFQHLSKNIIQKHKLSYSVDALAVETDIKGAKERIFQKMKSWKSRQPQVLLGLFIFLKLFTSLIIYSVYSNFSRLFFLFSLKQRCNSHLRLCSGCKGRVRIKFLQLS